MTNEEKARVILEQLDEYVVIDWNFEKYYVKAIVKGFKEIEQREQEENEEI